VRTYSPKPGEIERRWHVIDASDVLPVVRMLLLAETNVQGQSYMIDGGAAS